jgi:hypothetical protein
MCSLCLYFQENQRRLSPDEPEFLCKEYRLAIDAGCVCDSWRLSPEQVLGRLYQME